MATISENQPQHDYKNRKSKDGAAREEKSNQPPLSR
jgi:hypothetical protein